MQSELDLFKGACEGSFSFFCKQFLKVVEPETEFKWNWHLDVVCQACEDSYYGRLPKLDINIPPRMLKSLIVSVLFPCWVWTKKPSSKFLCAARSFDLSFSFNIKRRDVIKSDLYQMIWGIQLRDDSDRVDEFKNRYGGLMKSVSALGKVTGEGGDFLLSDDLLDAMDAFSKTKRNAVREWYRTAFYNRAQDKKTVRRININQRLHQQDISNLLEEIGFDRIVLPMVKEESDRSTIDFKDPRKEGEFLFPERYGEEEKQDEMKALGHYGWSSQYQQRPVPIGGGIIKQEWLRFYEGTRSFQKIIITADLSFKGGEKNDYNSIACWGTDGTNKYLIDLIRGKWTFSKTKEMFSAFCSKHNAQLKYVEDKANGSALIDDLKKDIIGLRAWPQQGSNLIKAGKVERLYFVQPDFESGLVYLPKNLNIIDSFIEELLGFTDNGSTTGNDDMVDVTTMGLLELRKSKTFFAG